MDEAAEFNRRGNKLAREAEKLLADDGFLSNLFKGRQERLAEAIGLYEAAANSYKVAKNCGLSRGELCSGLLQGRKSP
jgi:hypothetical protein